MKVRSLIFLIVSYSLGATSLYAGTYGADMKTDLKRGLKNIVSAPAEIGIGFQEYHEGPGRPVLRQMVGIVDGTLKASLRLLSGVWDLIEAPIPGSLQGLPVNPETFFE